MKSTNNIAWPIAVSKTSQKNQLLTVHEGFYVMGAVNLLERYQNDSLIRYVDLLRDAVRRRLTSRRLTIFNLSMRRGCVSVDCGTT